MPNIASYYIHVVKILASLRSWAGTLDSDKVRNLKKGLFVMQSIFVADCPIAE